MLGSVGFDVKTRARFNTYTIVAHFTRDMMKGEREKEREGTKGTKHTHIDIDQQAVDRGDRREVK